MTPARLRRWWVAAGAVVAVALFGGRWAAIEIAEHAWGASVAGGDVYLATRDFARLLRAVALLAAVGWGTGQLFLVYRAIGSVQVPRRLGDIEIAEAVPRWLLLAVTIGGGAVYGWLLALGTGRWWSAALLAAAPPHFGVADPLLHRDVGDYLAAVPWTAMVQDRARAAAVSAVLVVGLLYFAIGSLRFERGRPVASPYARVHLGTLLAALAVVILWGAVLDPAEVVAGLHGPLDQAALAVRLPGSLVVAVGAGIVAALSLVWGWRGAPALVAHGWTGLLATQLVVYGIAPGLVRAAQRRTRTAERPELVTERRTFARLAAGLELVTPGEPPDAASAARLVRGMPLWDPLRVAGVARAAGVVDPAHQVAAVALHEPRRGPTAEWLVAPAPDDPAPPRGQAGPAWTELHQGVLARAGAPLLAVETDTGLTLTPAPTSDSVAWFGPGFHEYAVASAGDWPALVASGVVLDTWWRRAALAWVLQSPELLRGDPAGERWHLVWRRDVAERLTRLLPVAEFDAPAPVLADSALWWISYGYVSSPTFPLASPPRSFAASSTASAPATTAPGPTTGRPIYERPGFVGAVRAATGDTRLYLMPGHDSLSAAWARILGPLVLPADSLPPALRVQLVFPQRLLASVGAYLAHAEGGGAPDGWVARPAEPFALAAPQGEGGAGGRGGLWSAQGFETVKPPGFAALLAGTVGPGGPRLVFWRPAHPLERPTPLVGSQFTRPGVLRLWVAAGALLSVQALFAEPTSTSGAARIAELYLSWAGRTGHGVTPDAAYRALLAGVPGTPPDTTLGGRWTEARSLLTRADSALARGDLERFGRLYGELKRVLGVGRPSLAPLLRPR